MFELFEAELGRGVLERVRGREVGKGTFSARRYMDLGEQGGGSCGWSTRCWSVTAWRDWDGSEERGRKEMSPVYR